ncbi:MAG: hypothetical protein GY940_27675 [bacterium]|nr:hypothetical protein [bacterium]
MIVNINVENTKKKNVFIEGLMFGGGNSVLVDPGPRVELKGIRNSDSFLTFGLSNGIQLKTNHVDNFSMMDKASGYYFEAQQDGGCIFRRGSRKLAELRLIRSAGANRMSISLTNTSGGVEIFKMTFLELKKKIKAGSEYMMVQAEAKYRKPVLSRIDSYFLKKFSYSMRKIVEWHPEGISSASETLLVSSGIALACSILSMVGIGLTLHGEGLSYFALDDQLIAYLFTLDRISCGLAGNLGNMETCH